MIKIGELKQGDVVIVNDGGTEREGVVIDVRHESHEALIDNGIQEFWYNQDLISPLQLDETQLLKLGFEKEVHGAVSKYLRGPFRVAVENGDFSRVEMWYREDHRHFDSPLSVHHFQNLYHQMTKVYLEKA